MSNTSILPAPGAFTHELPAFYRSVRDATRELAEPLSDADATVQSMPDASPAKWHLAHTSWFFETMLLRDAPGYRLFDENYPYLFNSYYETLGARQPRPRRGMLTRPSLEEVLAYRDHVDAGVERACEGDLPPRAMAVLELGCHHEQQHQELLLTDILHLFAQNPLRPAYRAAEAAPAVGALSAPAGFRRFEGGVIEIGAGPGGFAFDCERPRHRVFLNPFSIADRLVTNVEWMEFIADGGYRSPLLWLSDGWARCCAENWAAPAYWEERDGEYWTMTLSGRRRVDLNAPVVHLSYFEADAYARWAKMRLPTEAEWEHAAAKKSPAIGNFVESGRLCPAPAAGQGGDLRQMFGDVWEWTQSSFSPYPHFHAPDGPMGEYNGKFMCGQFVLRGGSCATPASHMRATTRNFFPPDARWQFSGLRLARDGEA